MSLLTIGSILDTALATVTPAIATAWENMPYKNADGTEGVPVVGTPYQSINLLAADPTMLEMSQHIHREQGFMQVSLRYPLDVGTGDALVRAELIRTTFYAGRTFTSGGITVTIDGTPSILPGFNESDRFVLPVRIRFYSHVVRAS